jgi:hypothetical protein
MEQKLIDDFVNQNAIRFIDSLTDEQIASCGYTRKELEELF